jgi:preprotein translocase subunit SecA
VGVTESVSKAFTKVFGSRNERLLKRYARLAESIDNIEGRYRDLSDDALREVTPQLRQRLSDGEDVEEVLPDAFAALREASRRAQAHRHFSCQLIGGRVLHESKIAEMRTGEGKTIVCHLPAFMKVVEGQKVHIVTVNDYLVQRDAEFARPIFERLGVTVGYIQANLDSSGREGMRREAYGSDVTYGTNSEFGFDYLRDNMKPQRKDQAQGSLDYVIIDEVDSILIDEARTPLIISGPAHDDVSRYKWSDNLARFLVRLQAQANQETRQRVAIWGDSPPEDLAGDAKFEDALRRFKVDPSMLTEEEAELLGHHQYYVVQRDRKSVHITHQGVDAAQEEAQIGSFYVGANMDRPHLIENALRAHAVYEKDKEYVVQQGEVIIVDEFTGRLMHGRQWSDGLHQSVEAKENVRIKEETQTLATITIQNYFKLYNNLAGMTGTAITESAEFIKIYNLEVVEIPTNRPVNRVEHNDKIYATTVAKYDAIVEEIHDYHLFGRTSDPYILEGVLKGMRTVPHLPAGAEAKIDAALKAFKGADEGDMTVVPAMVEAYEAGMSNIVRGRPVLVGTTSVEDSEKLARLLNKRYGIDYEVLNAKQHAREADIVAKAGFTHTLAGDSRKRGNVTIATNMAGRGTDIKLELGVVNERCRVAEESSGSVLYPVGTTKCCISCREYDAKTQCSHCFKPKLDPRFPELGRRVCSLNTPCGLHIVGTERHEARRIDNQLRGRSGRQGDPGSSRFFLSLEDDLLKLFMPDWMLKMMARMGFAGGVSLEDKNLNKGIERAQRKVEERNFSSRKHLLEWDEPPNYQRKVFYTERQRILMGQGIQVLIWQMIGESVDDSVGRFLDRHYPSRCVSDWCRAALEVHIDADKLRGDTVEALQDAIRRETVSEARDSIQTSLGEYIDRDAPPSEWDINGLLRWSERTFNATMTQNQMRKMQQAEIHEWLVESAEAHASTLDLDHVAIYLDDYFGRQQLVDWARGKFDIQLSLDDIVEAAPDEAKALILERARHAYRQREVEYPVQYICQLAFQQSDNVHALEVLGAWVKAKYGLEWSLEHIQSTPPEDLRRELLELNRAYLEEGKLEAEVDQALSSHPHDELMNWARQRYCPAPAEDIPDSPSERFMHRMRRQLIAAAGLEDETGDAVNGDARGAALELGRLMMRFELTLLEQYVLLRIYDQCWKDHLLEMDQLKSAIQQRPIGGDQTHPQSQFAIEGRDLFNQMWQRIREHVTDRIFKVRLSDDDGQDSAPPAGTGPRPVTYQHADASGAAFASASAENNPALRPQNQPQKAETIRRDDIKVGRNQPCPCGSGKKYKQCCGKT